MKLTNGPNDVLLLCKKQRAKKVLFFDNAKNVWEYKHMFMVYKLDIFWYKLNTIKVEAEQFENRFAFFYTVCATRRKYKCIWVLAILRVLEDKALPRCTNDD